MSLCRLMFGFLCVLLLSLSTLDCRLLYAQTGFATLSGQITDSSGRLVPGVSVVLTNLNTNVPYPTASNNDGIYNLAALPPGIYRANVSKDGFKSVVKGEIELHTQDNVSLNFALQVGSVNETITVEAGGININTTDAAVSTVVDQQFVKNMPLNGRSLQDLWTLVPGVAQVPSEGPGNSGAITVNGQRTEANYFTVDGVSANTGTPPNGGIGGAGFGGGTPTETALGTTQTMVSVDALQEFRSNTSTYSAEYGRTPGGQFSFTTRSGSNDWHGSAFDYFRNEALDANNWFNNLYAGLDPQNASAFEREKERQNDFGGTLGGPVELPGAYNGRDRTFFFFSYEGLRLWTPQGTQVSSVPDLELRHTAPAPLQPLLKAFPLPNAGEDGLNDGLGIYATGISFPSTIDSISVRLDHVFDERFRVFGRYAKAQTAVTSYTVGFGDTSAINNWLVTLGTTWAITSHQSNDFRFNITQSDSVASYFSTNMGGATPIRLGDFPDGAPLPASGGALYFCFCYGGNSNGNFGYIGSSRSAQRQYNLIETYALQAGRHNLKFGVDWRRLATYVVPILKGESVWYYSEASVLANSADSALAYSTSPSAVEPVYMNLSTFAEDEWRMTPRLSLSLGLRWDINPAPTNATGPSPYTLDQITNLSTAKLAPAGTPLWRTDWGGFAPRVGLAYQINQTPNRQTVMRGGFGVFYDLGNTGASNGFLGPGVRSLATFSGVDFPLNSEQLNIPPPSIAPPYNASVYAFDPNLKLPYTLEWNVALQQAFGSRQTLTVTYLGSAGRRLLETYQIYPANNPNFGPRGGNGAYITRNGPTSDYNALQVQFQRTLWNGLSALASYAFSHSIDEASSNFQVFDLNERASSDFDVRHNFQAALTYDVPGSYSNDVLRAVLGGWGIDTRLMARSALPVDIIGNQTVDPVTGTNQSYHPNRVPGQPLYLYGSLYPGGRVINYNAFEALPAGVEGDSGRNSARSFGAWQINLAIRRNFPIHERLHLQFRAEAFNLFNHPNFEGIARFLPFGPYDPSTGFGFGAAQYTLNNALGDLNPLYQTGGPRSLQIALKLTF